MLRLGVLLAKHPVIVAAEERRLEKAAAEVTNERVLNALLMGGCSRSAYHALHMVFKAAKIPVRVHAQGLADAERGMATMMRQLLPPLRLPSGCGYDSLFKLQALMAQTQLVDSGFLNKSACVLPDMCAYPFILRFDAFMQNTEKMCSTICQMLTVAEKAHRMENISLVAMLNGDDGSETLRKNLQSFYAPQLEKLHFYGQAFDLLLKLPNEKTVLVEGIPFEVRVFFGSDALGMSAIANNNLSSATFDMNTDTTRENSRSPVELTKVNAGDTLASVAKANGMDVWLLRFLNTGSARHQHRVNTMLRQDTDYSGDADIPDDFDAQTHVRFLPAGIGDDDPIPADCPFLVVCAERGEARIVTDSPFLQFLYNNNIVGRLLWCELHYRICTASSFCLQMLKPIMDKYSSSAPFTEIINLVRISATMLASTSSSGSRARARAPGSRSASRASPRPSSRGT
jgi:hypothetical protein